MNNRTLLSKAAIDTATLGTGGKMNAEQSTQFISFMKEYSAFLRMIQTINMQSVRREVDFGDVSERNLRKQKEGSEHEANGTFKTSKRELEAVGVIMAYDVSFQFIKENIERANINNTLARRFAAQFANDSVDLGFNGDSASEDEFLKINDGWIKIGENDSATHKVDTNCLTTMMEIFDALLTAIPHKYYQMFQREDKSLLKILCSPEDNRQYKKELQARNTALGDALITGGKNVTYDGFEIIPVGFMPEGVRMVTPLANLTFGVYGPNMESYHEVKPRKLVHEYTILGDTDYQIVNPDVLAIGKDRTD